MSAASRQHFAEVVRAREVDVALACLLVGCEVEPDLDLSVSLGLLERLGAQTATELARRGDAPDALAAALGARAGFVGAAQDYEDIRSSLLHEVLRRGRGLPITLSVVWCAVAARAGVVAEPLAVPGHVLVRVGGSVVDPFHGGRRVQDADGTEAVLEPVPLLLRLLTNVRVLTTRQGQSLESSRTRLWATELSLLLPRHPVELRRERGELLVRLGDHLGGAAELELYASVVEDADEQAAERARRDAQLARARLN